MPSTHEPKSHIGRRLVEDEDAGVLQQRACHAQQLPLAGAQVGAALCQLSVQPTLPVRPTSQADKVMVICSSSPWGAGQLFVTAEWTASCKLETGSHTWVRA